MADDPTRRSDAGVSLHDVGALVRSRRSVRHYRRQRVERALIDRLLEAALWAPSNWNGQPWQFVVLDDPRVLEQTRALLEERAQAFADVAARDVRLQRFVEHCRRYFQALHDCDCLILACYKPAGRIVEAAVAEALDPADDPASWNPNLISLGMAVQNLLLAAHAAGLGACFHSGPVAFLRGGVHELLGLPRLLQLAGVVTLGWPSPEAPAREPTRKALARIVRFPGEES